MVITRDEQEAAKGSLSWRDPRKDKNHVTLSLDGYAPFVKQIIKGGASIICNSDNEPEVARLTASRVDQWGFNTAWLKQRGERLGWPDQELLYFLSVGCAEYCQETPPVSWFAPHSRTVYAGWTTFFENVSREIADGWLVRAWFNRPRCPSGSYLEPPSPNSDDQMRSGLFGTLPSSGRSACVARWATAKAVYGQWLQMLRSYA